MPEVTCPECGLVVEIETMRKSAEEFCRHCDYPLFWARTAFVVNGGAPASGATLRRLPGAGGRVVLGTKVCPSCGELNPLAETNCIRCGSDLEPRLPEPEPPAPIPVAPPPVLVAPPPPPSRLWLWVLIAAVFILVTLLVIWAVA